MRALLQRLGLVGPKAQHLHRAASGWETRCERCGKFGARMVEAPWMLVLVRYQHQDGVGCMRRMPKSRLSTAARRPRDLNSRQVWNLMAGPGRPQHHSTRSRGRVVVCKSADEAVGGHPGATRVFPRPGASKAEVDTLVREGRRVAKGLPRSTRRRMGL